MAFTGFTPETSAFLWDLAFHNERPWFQEHKDRFLRVLKDPFDALARETLERVRAAHPEEPWQVHISRIYRDARRLFGRGPYKDHLWFTVWSGADKNDNPAFWFQVSASAWGCGVGLFNAEPFQMEAYRAWIEEHPAEMEALIRPLDAQDRFRLDGEDYRRRKKDVGERLNPWYNKKWVGLSHEEDFGGDILSPDFPDRLAADFEALLPYYRFFRRFMNTERKSQ